MRTKNARTGRAGLRVASPHHLLDKEGAQVSVSCSPKCQCSKSLPQAVFGATPVTGKLEAASLSRW